MTGLQMFPSFTEPTVKPRVTVGIDRSKQILYFGKTNVYPQYIADKISRSPMASRCTGAFHKFIFGEGFEDTSLNKQVVNVKRQTFKKILQLISESYAKHYGFALRFQYNMLLQITQIHHVPFEDCRMGVPDKYGYVSKYAVFDNWNNDLQKKENNEKDVQYVHRFNPRPEVVQSQIDDAGGIRQYNGQVLYWTPEVDNYPAAPLDPCIDDVDTDARMSVYKNVGTYNDFMPSCLFIDPNKYERDKNGYSEREEDLLNSLNDLQGVDRKGKILHINMPDLPADAYKDYNPLIPIQPQNTDRLFEFTETSCENRIRRQLGVPKPLISEFDGNSLSQSAAILMESVNVFNMETRLNREDIEMALDDVAQVCPFLMGKSMKIKEKYASDAKKQTTNSQGGFRGEGGPAEPDESEQAGAEDNGSTEV